MGQETLRLMEEFKEQYPAHLHIDLLPECQGKGLGRQLIEKLKEYLRKDNACGLMLDVAADNTGGIAFYKKCGFDVIRENKNESLMGIKL